MKNFLLFLTSSALSLVLTAQTTIDFESFNLATGEFINDAEAPFFEVGTLQLPSDYNAQFDAWQGWSISATTDVSTPGFMNQYSAITGGGLNGSTTYAVAHKFGAENELQLTGDAVGAPVAGFYITNATYAYLSMLEGDSFTKQFGGETGNDEDYFLLTISGELNGERKATTVEFYLADYRFADNSMDYIVDEWTYVDLTSLGNVDKLYFDMSSTDNGDYGMNTPAYFCVDDITTIDMPVSAIERTDLGVTLYPNPTVNHLFLEWPAQSGQAVVYDQQGRAVRSFTLREGHNDLNVSSLPAGTYTLRYQSEQAWNIQQFVKF